MGTIIGPWENHSNENNELKEENEKLKQYITHLEQKVKELETQLDNDSYYECRGC